MINFELKFEGIHTHIIATKKSSKKIGVYTDFTSAKAALNSFYRHHQRNWRLAATTARKLATLEIVTDDTVNGRGSAVLPLSRVRKITSAKAKTKTTSRRWNSRRAA